MNLTDLQILTIVVSLVIPLAALIHSNRRVSDVYNRIGDFNNGIGDVKEVLRVEMGVLRSDLMLQFEKLSNKMAENHRELLLEIRAHMQQHHPR